MQLCRIDTFDSGK